MKKNIFNKTLFLFIASAIMIILLATSQAHAIETGVRDGFTFSLEVKKIKITYTNGTVSYGMPINESSDVEVVTGDTYYFEVLEIKEYEVVLDMMLYSKNNETLKIRSNVTSELIWVGNLVITNNISYWEDTLNNSQVWSFNYTLNEKMEFNYIPQSDSDSTRMRYVYDAVTGTLIYMDLKVDYFLSNGTRVGVLEATLEKKADNLVQIGVTMEQYLGIGLALFPLALLLKRTKKKS